MRRPGAGLLLALAALSRPFELAAQKAEPPTNVTAASTAAGVMVSWTPIRSRGVTYRILRAMDARVTGIDQTDPTDMASFLDTKAQPGTTYFYQVVAVYADGTTGAALPVLFAVPMAGGRPPALAAGKGLAPGTGMRSPLATRPCAERPDAKQAPAVELDPVLGNLTAALNGSAGFPSSNPGGARLGWRAIPGGTTYVVERSVEGTGAWGLLTTSCASPAAFQVQQMGPAGTDWIVFPDVSGGVIARTNYLYRVTVAGSGGQVWWNQLRWTAPDLVPPRWYSAAVPAPGQLRIQWRIDSPGNPFAPIAPSSYTLSAPTGWKVVTGPGPGGCVGLLKICQAAVLNPPAGTHLFTLTAEWRVQTAGVSYVVATSHADTTLVIP